MAWWAWIVWAFLVSAQKAANTWVGRARTSGSVKWNAVAQAASSVLWIVNQLVIISSVFEAMRSGSWNLVVLVAIVYVAASVIGSVVSHDILLRVEKGSRRVGYYEDNGA